MRNSVVCFRSEVRALLVAIACTAVAGPPAVAGDFDDAIVTDRPDFTESPTTVPPRGFQIESGATFGKGDVWNLPELLLRFSPIANAELRLEPPQYLGVGETQGLGDMRVGAKVHLGEAVGWDFGVIGMVSLPIGDDEFTSDAVDPEIIVTGGRDLMPRLSLGVQGSVAFPEGGDGDRTEVGSGTIVLGIPIRSRAGTFFEVLTEVADGVFPVVTLHHGYTLLISPDRQFDIHVGLVDQSDYFMGAGYSHRFSF